MKRLDKLSKCVILCLFIFFTFLFCSSVDNNSDDIQNTTIKENESNYFDCDSITFNNDKRQNGSETIKIMMDGIEKTLLQDALSAYDKFLNGEINAYEPKESASNGGSIHISNIADTSSYTIYSPYINSNSDELLTDTYTKYALFDMNEDGIPELHLSLTLGSGYMIFTYINGQVVLWYAETGHIFPLNNGAILYKRESIPNLTAYQYIILDFYGNEINRIKFYKSEGYEDEQAYIPIYNFDGEDVTKETWEAFTEQYLSVKYAVLEWHKFEIDFPLF